MNVTKTEKGHCYQIVDGKKVRISQSKYEKLVVVKKKTPTTKNTTKTKTSTKKSHTKRSKPTTSIKTERKYTRFYDDSPDNIADVITHGDIECIHVPRVNTIVPRGMTYNEYVSKYGGWSLKTSDKDLQQVLTSLHNEVETEEVSDSLTPEHMSELRRWVRSKPKGSCRVMFDFDRVINQVEGMIAGSLKTITDQHLNISGLAKYHIGSKNRLKDFRKTLNELLKFDTNVSVVTNNPGCRDESFVAVLNYVHPVFTKSTVHCSYRFANKLNCMSAKKLVV
jgi:hypothetical protein